MTEVEKKNEMGRNKLSCLNGTAFMKGIVGMWTGSWNLESIQHEAEERTANVKCQMCCGKTWIPKQTVPCYDAYCLGLGQTLQINKVMDY